MPALTPRPYQSEAVESIYQHFWEHSGNPLVVLPTGTGKSFVIAMFLKGVVERWPNQRILVLTHVKELIAQNFAELKSLWPFAAAGIYSAGLKRRELNDHPITFAGIQSIHSRAADVGHVDLIIIDEAHLIPRSSQTMYGKFLSQLAEINPHLRCVGLTATPYRMDSGRLDKGDGALFSRVCYEAPVDQMIEAGYLSDLRTVLTENQMSSEGAKVRGGDWVASDLAEINDTDALNEAVVAEIVKRAEGRKKLLVFALSVEHAGHIAELLNAAGCSARMVSGESTDRDEIISGFRAGEFRALVNMSVLTTGFNVPDIDCLVILRPTKSVGLYVQIVGRGMRTAKGKDNCLVLDFGGNVERHGPINGLRVKRNGDSGGDTEPGEAPVKICGNEDCRTAVPLSACQCYSCGFVFPKLPTPSGFSTTPTSAEIIKRPQTFAELAAERLPKCKEVAWTEYGTHQKMQGSGKSARRAGPFMLLVEHHCALDEIIKEYICFEHEGFARQKAADWWISRGGKQPAPATVADALKRISELREFTHISVGKDGKFFRVFGTRNSPSEVSESTRQFRANHFTEHEFAEEIAGWKTVEGELMTEEDLPF